MSGCLFMRLLRSGRGCRKGRLWRRRAGLGLGGRGKREGGDDFLGGGFADLAVAVVDAALRERVLAAAIATFGVEFVERDDFLPGEGFGKIHARGGGRADGV